MEHGEVGESVLATSQPYEMEINRVQALESLLRATEKRVPVLGGIVPVTTLDKVGIAAQQYTNQSFPFNPFNNDGLIVEYPENSWRLVYTSPSIKSNLMLNFIPPEDGFTFPYRSLLPYSSGDYEIQYNVPIARYIPGTEMQQQVGQWLYVNICHNTPPNTNDSVQRYGIVSRGEAITTELSVKEVDTVGSFASEGGYRYLFRVPISDLSYTQQVGEADGLSLSHLIPADLLPQLIKETYPYPSEIGLPNPHNKHRTMWADSGKGAYCVPQAYIVGRWPIEEKKDKSGLETLSLGEFESHKYTPPQDPEHFLLYRADGTFIRAANREEVVRGLSEEAIGHVWAIDSDTQLVYRYFHNPDIKSFDPHLGLFDFQQMVSKVPSST